jgi:dTDP-N-acetylfucosamine:lipid II N-acetylfucosaminyltransferase
MREDKMKQLHLFTADEKQKFSIPFINLIEQKFNNTEHFFIMLEKGKEDKLNLRENMKYMHKNFSGVLFLISKLYKSDKIYIHGLNSYYLIFLLFIQPWLLRKCNWIIWGGDLYFYKNRPIDFKSNLKEWVRNFVIKNMGGLITQIKGDYELAQKWYGAKGKYYYSFVYPSNLFKEYDLKEIKKYDEKIYIQVGNSACNTNEHIEVFEKLSKYKNENILIVCPLSYSGKEDYIDKVIECGVSIFGEDKFMPITEFVPFDEYLELLAKVDIAIFNHTRQRGLGNITTLLGLGKKVYIREEITTWSFCIDHNLKVYSANAGFEDLFEEIDENIKERNIKNIKKKFSEKKLIEDLMIIFSEEN